MTINIIRSKHTPENSIAIHNRIVDDRRLSPSSFAILHTLLRRSDTKNPQPIELKQSELAERHRLSVSTIRKCLYQLQECGYVVRQSNGRFVLPASTIAENTFCLTAEEIEAWHNEMANRQ
jgi:DNA-binding MarR family transcriptional regulator